MLAVWLFGCETWTVPQGRTQIDCPLNSFLRKINKVTGYNEAVENKVRNSFIICTLHQTLLGQSNQESLEGRDKWHTCKRREMYKHFRSEKLTGKKHLGHISLMGDY
jgi:hypothetical protein